MLIAPETSQDERLDEELVKNLTGGDKLRARRMREDEWSFSPTHTAFIHTNYRPRIRGVLIVDDTRAITAKALRELYQSWCTEAGETAWSPQRLGRDLAGRGLDSAMVGTNPDTNLARLGRQVNGVSADERYSL